MIDNRMMSALLALFVSKGKRNDKVILLATEGDSPKMERQVKDLYRERFGTSVEIEIIDPERTFEDPRDLARFLEQKKEYLVYVDRNAVQDEAIRFAHQANNGGCIFAGLKTDGGEIRWVWYNINPHGIYTLDDLLNAVRNDLIGTGSR